MEFDVSYSLENEQQFWDELDEIVNSPCETSQLIDNHLKSYLGIVTSFQGEYLQSASDWAQCGYLLLDSPLFTTDKTYTRNRLIGRLRTDDSNPVLYLASTILLCDGRQNRETFEVMQAEGLFPRLLEVVGCKKASEDKECRNRLLDVLYEMSRVQRLRWEDLAAIDDAFIIYLFELVEEQAEMEDPYHYVVIRVLLVLNEQYMVSAHAPPLEGENSAAGQEVLTNKIIKILCFKGDVYKTFGENIILLLNRETETSLQLLILKLIYLLCTTSATYEYFYRNDLYVLCDVVIRNLLDLPDDAESLRHTYLRVLYPLLSYTQLRKPPFYKRLELLSLFHTLASIRYNHFEPVDETTTRLVTRCRNVPWLVEEKKGEDPAPGGAPITIGIEAEKPEKAVATEVLEAPPPTEAGKGLVVPISTAAALGMALDEAVMSEVEVAAVVEKPGVMAPSRSRKSSGAAPPSVLAVRPPPPPPPPHVHHHVTKSSSPPPPPQFPPHASISPNWKPNSPPLPPTHPPQSYYLPPSQPATPPPEKKHPPPPPSVRRRGIPPPPPKPRGTPRGNGTQTPATPSSPPSRLALGQRSLSNSSTASMESRKKPAPPPPRARRTGTGSKQQNGEANGHNGVQQSEARHPQTHQHVNHYHLNGTRMNGVNVNTAGMDGPGTGVDPGGGMIAMQG
ncbi:hypothetical protein BGX38DRAFT_1330311 [Terfezia claveryi]|nr:hypothetical protein BGX38DRAFT_1330311 [Terfezia claveryi]